MRGGEFSRLAQGHDESHIFCARAASLFLLPAQKEGPELHTAAHVQRADALGGMQLVAGKGQVIHGQLGQLDGNFSHGLHGVGMEGNAARPGQGGCFRNGKDDAAFVVGVHDGHQRRIVPHGRCQRIKAETPFFVHLEECHAISM